MEVQIGVSVIRRVHDPVAAAALLRSFFGSDPEGIEVAYDKLRSRMIHYFAARRCPYPDELADQVIERALEKIAAQAPVTDLTRYCYGIAANLRSEKRRKRTEEELVSDFAAPGSSSPGRIGSDERLLLLRECLAMISARDRELLCEYYLDDRKELAGRLQLTANALRLRVFHAIGQIRGKMKGSGPGPSD